jgi:hypothetical protein
MVSLTAKIVVLANREINLDVLAYLATRTLP